MRTTDEQFAGLIQQARHFLDIIEEGRAKKVNIPPLISGYILLARTRQPARDGFRKNTLGSGTPSTVTDENGDPMPPVNDPTGELVANIELYTDPVRRQAAQMISYLNKAVGDLSGAVSSLGQASQPVPVEDNPGCKNHQRFDNWEPVYRSERCRFCYDWNLIHGEDAPGEILERRSRGERITSRVVEEVLGRRHNPHQGRQRRHARR